jgi:hypothetical protein
MKKILLSMGLVILLLSVICVGMLQAMTRLGQIGVDLQLAQTNLALAETLQVQARSQVLTQILLGVFVLGSLLLGLLLGTRLQASSTHAEPPTILLSAGQGEPAHAESEDASLGGHDETTEMAWLASWPEESS